MARRRLVGVDPQVQPMAAGQAQGGGVEGDRLRLCVFSPAHHGDQSEAALA